LILKGGNNNLFEKL